MTCTGDVCGTGGWTGPLPGDPDNNVALSANTAYGGIIVSWSWPQTNGNAVAHTLLYRATVNDYSKAVLLAVVGGSIHFDKISPDTPTTYYYWIKIVSVNGTEGALVGPVSAEAEPLGQQNLVTLTGLIDEGILAQSLKTEIARIGILDGDINETNQSMLSANATLSAALAAVQSNVDTALTYVNTEITQRRDADSAQVNAINALSAGLASNAAAITDEQTVRATKDAAMAQDITVLYATTATSTAAIETEQQARASADDALSQRITTVESTANSGTAAIQDEATARSNADGQLANQINTVQSTLNGNIAQVQQTLQTNINIVNGKVDSITAVYTVKLNNNGLIGGFGLSNDGTVVQAGFDVDSFWIGRTNSDMVKPFIIDGDTVYIDKVRIRDADIDTLKIAGNAVTIPVSSYTSGAINCNYGSTTVQSAAINSSGAPIWVSFSAYVVPALWSYMDSEGTVSEATSPWHIELWRNGTRLFRADGPTMGTNGSTGMLTYQIQDIPGAVAATYELHVVMDGDSSAVNGSVSNRIINLMETKR